MLIRVPRGEMQKHLWLKLGTVFIPNGSDKTLAEMPEEEYLKWRESTKKDSLGLQLGDWLLERWSSKV